MTEFTKEELENILTCVNAVSSNNNTSAETLKSSKEKLISLIENFDDEQEFFSCYTGLAVGDDFFKSKLFMMTDDLMPAFFELCKACDGKIDKPGIYAFKLKIVKMK